MTSQPGVPGDESSGAVLRDVSDTALWVALDHARETERRHPLFRDPFARRLAGARRTHRPHAAPGAPVLARGRAHRRVR